MLNETVECPKCGAVIGENDKFCKKCGTKLLSNSLEEYTGGGPTTQQKYSALRTIAAFCKVMAYIWLIGSIIFGIISIGEIAAEKMFLLPAPKNLSIFLSIVGSVVSGVIGFIIFLAASETIKLFIDIEENTRLTNDLLRRFINKGNS